MKKESDNVETFQEKNDIYFEKLIDKYPDEMPSILLETEQNEENNQKRLHELYNYDKLFQNKDKTDKNQNCIVEYKENFWTRISKFFKKLFGKI